MIIAIEDKKNVWDFSCANNDELFKALEISFDILYIKFIDFSKLSFGASISDIEAVTNALSKKGIGLCYDNDDEVMIPIDTYTDNSHEASCEIAKNYSDESLVAIN